MLNNQLVSRALDMSTKI